MVVWGSGSCKGQRWLCGTVVVVRDRDGCVGQDGGSCKGQRWLCGTVVVVRDRDGRVGQW